ncbi:MAG: aminomethyl-transferring glycine dehydrogenase subunit GcvPA [Christensenellaceae bacterium]|jgi:glycine dehydrogenase subunit 1|nr:aminomethyl-transferring glycine dehydrogenase subunit GcvPA [Christensenellaceae bacterium]
MKSYVPNTVHERQEMLQSIGLKTMDDLYADVPQTMKLSAPLQLPAGKSEQEVRRIFQSLLKNTCVSMPIFRGAGAYNHYIPSVVPQLASRNELYTAYTPYQTEMSQGMLQAIFEYQSLICELTGMDAANASVYDGAHACSETMVAMKFAKRKDKVLYSAALHPDYIATLKTYARFLRIELVEVPLLGDGRTDIGQIAALGADAAGMLAASPNFYGVLEDMAGLSEAVHGFGGLFGAVVNPLSLGAVKRPSEYGADFALGDAQPLGMPLNFGGPYLGFVTTHTKLVRNLSGRIVGQTTDDEGNRVYCLTLSAREQHIRREKASSNICSNQCLCVLMSSIYMATMGPAGMAEVAEQNLQKAHYLAQAIAALPNAKLRYADTPFFNEFVVDTGKNAAAVNEGLKQRGIMGGLPLSRFDATDTKGMLWCATEMNTREEMDAAVAALKEVLA